MVKLRDITLSDAAKKAAEAALGVTLGVTLAVTLAVGGAVGECIVGSVAERLVSAIKTHAEAVGGNDALIKNAVRSAEHAGSVLTTLREANFPEECYPAYSGVVETLANIVLDANKWTRYSTLKKACSFSWKEWTSNANKHRKYIEECDAQLR